MYRWLANSFNGGGLNLPRFYHLGFFSPPYLDAVYAEIGWMEGRVLLAN